MNSGGASGSPPTGPPPHDFHSVHDSIANCRPNCTAHQRAYCPHVEPPDLRSPQGQHGRWREPTLGVRLHPAARSLRDGARRRCSLHAPCVHHRRNEGNGLGRRLPRPCARPCQRGARRPAHGHGRPERAHPRAGRRRLGGGRRGAAEPADAVRRQGRHRRPGTPRRLRARARELARSAHGNATFPRRGGDALPQRGARPVAAPGHHARPQRRCLGRPPAAGHRRLLGGHAIQRRHVLRTREARPAGTLSGSDRRGRAAPLRRRRHHRRQSAVVPRARLPSGLQPGWARRSGVLERGSLRRPLPKRRRAVRNRGDALPSGGALRHRRRLLAHVRVHGREPVRPALGPAQEDAAHHAARAQRHERRRRGRPRDPGAGRPQPRQPPQHLSRLLRRGYRRGHRVPSGAGRLGSATGQRRGAAGGGLFQGDAARL